MEGARVRREGWARVPFLDRGPLPEHQNDEKHSQSIATRSNYH